MENLINGIHVHSAEPAEATQPVSLLFIHGLWATHQVWLPFLDFFTGQGYRCAAIDLRGRGQSAINGDLGKATIEDFVTDAMGVANAMGKVVVIGHSMGGLIAQKVAHEMDLAGAVFVTPAPPRGVLLIGGMDLTAQMLLYMPKILGGEAFSPTPSLMNTFVFHRLSPEEQEKAFSLLVPDSGTAMRNILLGEVPVSPERIACPTLAISGHGDKLTPKNVVAKIADRYGSDYTCYAEHSHWLVQEPGYLRIADDIHRWLQAKVVKQAD